jgi:hypothetical protein
MPFNIFTGQDDTVTKEPSSGSHFDIFSGESTAEQPTKQRPSLDRTGFFSSPNLLKADSAVSNVVSRLVGKFKQGFKVPDTSLAPIVNEAKDFASTVKDTAINIGNNVIEGVKHPLARLESVAPDITKVLNLNQQFTPEQQAYEKDKFINAVIGFTGNADFSAGAISGSKIPKPILDFFAKESNPEVISTAIQKTFKLDPILADEVSVGLSKAKTASEVKQALLEFRTSTPTASVVPEIAGVPSKQEAKSVVSRVVEEVKATVPAEPIAKTPVVPKEDALTTEARKYKSAEEFVASQRKMYRGTATPQSGDLDVANTYGLAYGKGAYLASEESFAKQYGNNISELYPVLKKPFAMDKEVSPQFLVQFKKDFPSYNEKYGTTGEDIHSFLQQDDANEYLQKHGYDGLIDAASEGSKQTIVFDPKNIKTKSQLIDIYNKAVGETKPKLQVSEDQNLITQHNISERKLLYAHEKGGLPVPSLAIANKNTPLTNFGEITLIGDKQMIDPSEKENKVFNADVYSKRFPRLETTVKSMDPVQKVIDETKDYFTNLDLPEWINYDKATSIQSNIQDEGIDGMKRDFAVQRAFAAKNEISPTSTSTEIEDYVNNKENRARYQSFVEDLYKQIVPSERIFKGFTYSGRRRYSPATIENIIKEMKGAVKDTEGFNYGVASIRASQAKQFKTLDSILKNRGKIVSENDMELIKDGFDREFNELLDTYDISDLSTFTENLKDFLKGKIRLSEFKQYTGISDEGASAFVQFAKQLKEAPTEYFEVKKQRLVGIGEFKTAVVPNDISINARKVLEDQGIEIVEYDPQIKGDREIKIKDAADKNNIAFRKGVNEFSDGITPQEAEAKIRELFDDHEVQLITGEDIGSLIKMDDSESILRGFHQPKRVIADLIGLVERDGKVSNSTLYHESFHAYMENFVAPAEKANVIKYIMENKVTNAAMRVKYSDKNYPTLEEKAEEWLADDFANFVKTGNADAPLRNFFQRILDRIRKWIRGIGKLDDLYERILKKDRSTVNPKTASKKPSMSVDGEKTPQEILAEAEASAKKPGGQQDRLRGLAEIARNSDTYEDFIYNISNNSLLKEWRADVQESGFNHFANFYKTQKSLKEGVAPVISKPIAKSVAQVIEESPSLITTPEIKVESARSVPESKIQLSPELQKMSDEISIRKDSLEGFSQGLPIGDLQKYVMTSGDMEGRFPEVTGTDTASYLADIKKRLASPKLKNKDTIKNLQNILDFAKNGDAIVTEYGFNSVEDATDAFEKYTQEKNAIRDLEKEYRMKKREFIAEERDRYAIEGIVTKQEKLDALRKVEAILREEGRNRAQKIKAIADHFKIPDSQMKKIVGTKDFRLLSDKDFENLLKKVQGMAYDEAQLTEARLMVQQTIDAKDLKKVENLRQAMKLPKIENMSLKQLDEFDTLLNSFEMGDEFLGIRQLETLKNTDIADIHTKREALESLAKSTGSTVADLQDIKINWLNKFESGTSLARQNPFFERMVMDTNAAKISAGIRFHEFKNELNQLLINARKTRSRGLVDRLVPTDELIFRWLEASDKEAVAKTMTPQEIQAAQFIQKKYAEIRDYLVEQGVLKKYRENYITHIRRGFLEALKDGGPFRGFKNAIKELFDNYKMEEANFNILNDQTGEILPLEKFFKYSMARSDKLIPSKNVAKAVMNYVRTFETKVALDSIVPKIDVYAHALTPGRMTPRGLEYDSSIKRFVKQWLNTQKGRPVDIGFIKAGDKLDWAIRSGVALTRVLDLALNIPVGLASNVGEQVMTFTELGAKQYAKGLARSLSTQGKLIIKHYETMVGETLWTRLSDTSKDIGDKFTETFFSLFSIAARKANVVEFLGMLSPEEFKTGVISSQRLAEMKNAMGKWRAVEDAPGSLLGKTAIGSVFKQYKSWAYPIASTTRNNIKVLIKMAKEGKNPTNSKEFAELLRVTLATAAILLVSYGAYKKLDSTKSRTFMENLAYKSMGDGLSLFAGLSPATWGTTPRLIAFLNDLSTSVVTVGASLITGNRTSEGNIPGATVLKQTITPKIVKTLSPSASKDDPATAEVRKVYNEAQALIGEGRQEEADALVSKAFPETPEGDAGYEIYKKLKTADKKKETEQAVLGMKDTVDQVYKLKQDGKDDEVQAIVDAMTDDEYHAYELAKKRFPPDGSKPQYTAGEEVPEDSVINSVLTYAKAIGTDPVTAFNRIFTGQHIRRVDNGAIIVNRMSLSDSEAVKKSQGATKDMRLDHTVPLELGGSNNKGNLKLVPEAVWASYSPVENYLGKALREGRISKKQAQSLIQDFKEGLITFEGIQSQVK